MPVLECLHPRPLIKVCASRDGDQWQASTSPLLRAFLFSNRLFCMKFMLGTKGRMTQVFDDKGIVSAATIVNAGPLTVAQVKTAEKDGYAAVQVGFGTKKE